MSTFWTIKDDLDPDQRAAVEGIDEKTSFLLRGAAGSGKTNVLLLRAKYLALKKISDFRIVVFTSSLKRFVELGCEAYGIDPNCVVTQMSLFRKILDEYNVSYEQTKDFETDRTMLAGKALSLIESNNITHYCQAILVDEAQDYTDTELLVLRKLAPRLVLGADTRQSIYKATHAPGLIETLVSNNVVTLRFHYRSGLRLCKVADAILSDSANFAKVQGECRYPEAVRPSSVVPVPCGNEHEQMLAIVSKLREQLDLYAGERIGVLFPKKEQALTFSSILNSAGLPDLEAIRVDTLHGAKGWEFRAVHIGCCETLSRMGATQKRLIYTGVLRGRTSVHLYFSGRLPGYLDAALAVLEPPPPEPTFDDLMRSR